MSPDSQSSKELTSSPRPMVAMPTRSCKQPESEGTIQNSFNSHSYPIYWALLAKQMTNRLTASCSKKQMSGFKGLHSKQCSLIISIMLPLLLVFLLPTLKLDHQNQNHNHHNQQQHAHKTSRQLYTTTSCEHLHAAQQERAHMSECSRMHTPCTAGYWSHLIQVMFSEPLLALARFPFDRLRLTSGLMVVGVGAKEINSKQDLQEEETHLSMLQPNGEHRNAASYMPQHQPLRAPQGHQYQSGGLDPGVTGEQLHAGLSDAGYTGAGSMTSDGSIEPTGAAADGATELVSASGGLQTRNDLPAVRALNVKCEKNHMTVNIVFDRPFYGVVFSKGHYNDQKCIHLPPNSGQSSVNFDIHLGKCGMTSSEASGGPHATGLQQSAAANGQPAQPNGLYNENTVIIQYDPQVQEIYDQARKLRCTWYDYYEKSVTFRPYNVDMLDAVTANFLGDNIQCWMQIQVGKGPWSSEVAGIVKIGQTMTMVLAIKDEENRFDMLVRNCVAHDGKHPPIQLVDEYGCVARPKIMAKFQKARDFGPSASVVSYAFFQAFKFPDSMSVHFQCVIQVCRYECPEPVCQGQQQGPPELGQQPASSGRPGPSGMAVTDYTASGTEIVASKEQPPTGSSNFFAANHSMPHPNAAAVNLKLDESQGRVQVKLDTSMMAGMHQQLASSRAHGGPLPPHLLHTVHGSSSGNGDTLPAVGMAYGGAGARGSGNGYPSSTAPYYSKSPQGGATGSSVSGHNTIMPVSAQVGGRPAMLAGRASQVGQMAQPSGHGQMHFSPPYPHTMQRAAYATNRIGELAPIQSLAGGNGDITDDQSSQPVGQSSRSERNFNSDVSSSANPLSLMASPRALRMAIPVAGGSQTTPGTTTGTGTFPTTTFPSNHRHRRSVISQTNSSSSSGGGGNESGRRSARSQSHVDSTAIKTQKTIQVVSPDDVAFSLLGDDFNGGLGGLNEPLTITGVGGPNRRQTSSLAASDHMSTVCFSAGRLMFAVLVTLATIAATIVIVTFVILKQRVQLEKKLSSVVEDTNEQHHLAPEVKLSQQQQQNDNVHIYQQQQRHHNHNHSQNHRHLLTQVQAQQQLNHLKPTTVMATDELVARRQHEEIQQRNNYLTRLYSQFVPAAYWR